jgi:ABC-2 type transport system ATP-binding protein
MTSMSSPADPASNAVPAIRVDALSHTYPQTRSGAKPAVRRAPNANADVLASSNAGTLRPALDGVSLSVKQGEVFGILGPNGGGKSTLFRILSTLLRPSAGDVEVFGFNVITQPELVRAQLGVVFQYPSIDLKLTARENLTHQGHLYGLRGGDLAQRINDALAGVKLLERADDRTEDFSGGMRRRVEIAKAMLHRPRLLLLDEPSTGLDPGARRDVWEQLFQLRQKYAVTIAMTTHLMDEADRCDRLAILARGKLVATDTPANLKSRIGGDVVVVEPTLHAGGFSPGSPGSPGSDPTAATKTAAETLAKDVTAAFAPWSYAPPAVIETKVRIERDNGAAFVATLANAFPDRIHSISVARPTLEDVFMHLTGAALTDEA